MPSASAVTRRRTLCCLAAATAVTLSSSPLDVQAECRINGVSNGIMQIAVNRRIRLAGNANQTVDVQSRISYDSARSIPRIDEYVTQHVDHP